VLAPLTRVALFDAVRVLLGTTVVTVAAASNWSPSVRAIARPVWRAELVVLCALAVAYAWQRRTPWRATTCHARAVALAVAVAVVALASTVWSVDSRLTLERGASFTLALASAAALGLGVAHDRVAGERLLKAIVVGALVVAAAGLLVVLVSPHRAVQAATASTPTRYHGIGQNPNTVAMLFAAVLPLATWLLAEAGTRRRRAAAAGAFALLFGSIVASGSRGALVTGFVAVAFVVAATFRGRVRTRAAAATALVFAAGVAIVQIPQPSAAARSKPSPAIEHTTGSPRDAEGTFRQQDEVGSPVGDRYEKPSGRGLLSTSGRLQAWRGAIGQTADRPLVGYGFGVEDRVFVDRYYSFYGGVPENSYIGMALQLGVVGLALLVLLALVLLGGAVAALRRLSGADRAVTAAAAGVLVAGLVLGLFQSYAYAVGNSAMLTVWSCGFVACGLAPSRTPLVRLPPRRGLAALAGVGALLVLALAVGRWEDRRHARSENAGIARVRQVVGRLDSRSLDAFRILPRFDCLLYRRGANPYALELCVAGDGRVVEAIDRRGSRRISSLREQPSAATVRVDPSEVSRLVSRLDSS
jgi:hypothetical protein